MSITKNILMQEFNGIDYDILYPQCSTNFNQNIDMSNNRITNLENPVNNLDAVNKQYVDLNLYKCIGYQSGESVILTNPIISGSLGDDNGSKWTHSITFTNTTGKNLSFVEKMNCKEGSYGTSGNPTVTQQMKILINQTIIYQNQWTQITNPSSVLNNINILKGFNFAASNNLILYPRQSIIIQSIITRTSSSGHLNLEINSYNSQIFLNGF